MAAVVATMVVGPLVKIVTEKASNYLLDKYKVMKGMEKQHEILKRKLPAILDVITDAEQAATHREGAAAWLEAIKKVAYQANEVFDEFKYEALHRQARKMGQYKELGFDVVKLFPSHNPFIFRCRMGKKLRKIVLAIEVLVTEMNAFGFKYEQQPLVYREWRQTDQVIFDPKEIISRSRAKDNKNIVDILVGQANNPALTVVPIVGMGGLGKTTLAQLVYNEYEIEMHFDLLLWVCISDGFDVDSLAIRIVEAAPEKKDDSKKTAVASKQTPLDTLQNILSGKRYLLVLDDVWAREDRKWEQLKASLEHGGMGSVILTTTRDKRVAEIMGTVKAYNLGALEREYIKEIIEITAFSRLKKDEKRSAMLVNILGEIVERCAGSPLAAIALGSILRNKTSEEEWKAVSRRSNICTVESGILPILKLSYNDLPPHMKQCFAFCAIFPKDYEIDVDKLIRLWIAHGFIIQEEQVRLETIGKQIFNELASRSFFQDVKQVQATVSEIVRGRACYSRTTCKIHDLMHDVALSVMEMECALATDDPGNIDSIVATMGPCQREWLPNSARHLFLSCKEPGRKLNSSLENISPAIQTLLCDSGMISSLHHPSKYSSLQALQLCSEKRSFPLKLKYLHHLRYLDLSKSYIRALPKNMSILYNLQTLNLSGCEFLRELPRQMKYMTALRHLYTHGCRMLKSMPRDLRKLTSLQTLTSFVAGSGSNCSDVGELGHLNLGGQLELRHLQNVIEEDAKAANLVMKKELRELTLKWADSEQTSCRDDARVLEKLEPHDGLHSISIHSYGATTFPVWMAMLQNIVEIYLFHCKKLQWLFTCDSDASFAFPNLKDLTLQDLVCLERCSERNNVMQGDKIIFPRLEKLFILRCKKLTALPGRPTFPNLQHALILGCPELTTTAKSPKLGVLNMEGSEGELFPWVARHMTSLTNLELQSLDDSTETTSVAAKHGLREVLDGREKWNDHDFPLAALVLKNFKSGVKELCACFVHLQDLSIWNCSALVHWPEKEFQGLASLRRLLICKCNNLTGYAQASVEPSASTETSQLLPRLESLEIWSCKSLVEVFIIPASLRRMEIHYCTKLVFRSGRRLQQGQSVSPIYQGLASVPEVSSPSSPGANLDHLEELILSECDGLTGVLHIPPSVKKLEMKCCNGLTSLESRLGERPSLEYLLLCRCNTLSSLLDGPQAYSCLQCLYIIDCPGMKTLPINLQQRLGSLQREYIDAHYYGKPMLLKPRTWKYVCNS
ncbi:putative disease resistance protein RGA4 [Lolium rigidum]|uniref:putative disease resistance protein RGA4 n=1 Tax=Lolium rigidum TaxID=89674 RepID=UPI001F5D759C|nr:putative disease resistance protein RGA4 [Lolium rigidum]